MSASHCNRTGKEVEQSTWINRNVQSFTCMSTWHIYIIVVNISNVCKNLDVHCLIIEIQFIFVKLNNDIYQIVINISHVGKLKNGIYQIEIQFFLASCRN